MTDDQPLHGEPEPGGEAEPGGEPEPHVQPRAGGEPQIADGQRSMPRFEEAPLVPRWLRRTILVALSVLFVVVGMFQADRDAPTVDEGVDVSSGITSLIRRDGSMVPEHPLLPKALAALPALLAQPIVPDGQAFRSGDWFDHSDDFISANDAAGRLDDILLASRLVVLLEAVGCAALLGHLAGRAFGPDGALLAGAAWLTTPYVVGISHFAMIDVPFTLAVLGVSALLGRYLDAPSVGRTVVLGAGVGAALATRHTALVLAVLVVGVVAVSGRDRPRDAARAVGIVTLVAVAVLWAVYRLVAPSGPSGAIAANFEGLIASRGADSLPVRIVGALPVPLEWRAGFAYLDLTSTDRPSYLAGQAWDGGRWWYFPVSAALKLPLTLTAAIVGGWVLAVRSRLGGGRRSVGGRLGVLVVLPAVASWLLLLAQPLNLGLRLALPVLALSFVGLGAFAAPLARWVGVFRPRADGQGSGGSPPTSRPTSRPTSGPTAGPVAGPVAGLVAAAVVVAAQLAASVAAVPYSLAWTPPPFAPEASWVSDANLDAGQAAGEVRSWATEHDRPYAAVDTTRGYVIEGTRSLRGVDPASVRGWVAVGVTPLVQTRKGSDVATGGLAWLRKYCPVGTLGGGSILLYRFDEAPDPAPGPSRPAGPCRYGDGFSRVED